MSNKGDNPTHKGRVKRPPPRRKLGNEEKNLTVFCKPSKIISVNDFLRTHVLAFHKKVRVSLIKRSGFGFLLDLAINDPNKYDVMRLVRKRWGGEDCAVTEEHVRVMYGADSFGELRINLEKNWGDRTKSEFKEQMAGMGISCSEQLFLKIKDIEVALKRGDKCSLKDDDWAKLYILYALSVFLVAPTTDVISGKYWLYIVPLDQARKYDWIEHFTVKTNTEFVRSADSLRDKTHIKMGGNSHALLDYSNNMPRRLKARNATASAKKLPVRQSNIGELYEKMSLAQLYESFYKIHSERAALDKKFKLVARLIAEKEKTTEPEDDEDDEDKEKDEGDREDERDQVKDEDKEAEPEDDEDKEAKSEDDDKEAEPEDDEDKEAKFEDDDKEAQPEDDEDKEAKIADVNESRTDDDDARLDDLLEAYIADVKEVEPEDDEGRHDNVLTPDITDVNESETDVGEGRHDNVLEPYIANVETETKRKAPLSDDQEGVEPLNKKGKTIVEEETLFTPWNTQIIAEVSRVVDEVVKSASKPKPQVKEHESKVNMRGSRHGRVYKRSAQTRTPYYQLPIVNRRKTELPPLPKGEKDKKVVEDPDFEAFDERPPGFVSATPREFCTDVQITDDTCEAALRCYDSMTTEQKDVVELYLLDLKLSKDLPGQFVAFDHTTYLSRDDVSTLRPRLWVASSIVEFYARAKAREMHKRDVKVDRIVFPACLVGEMLGYESPDLSQKETIEHCNQLAGRIHKSVELAYPYVKSYISEIPYFIIPHCDNLHYTVYVIDTISKGCYILDSWKNIGEERLATLIHRGQCMQEYLTPFIHKVTGKECTDYQWKVLTTCPKQVDNISCGLFASMFVTNYTSDWASDNIPHFGWMGKLGALRKNICREIVIQQDNLLLPNVLSRALNWFEEQPKQPVKKSKGRSKKQN